MGKIAFLFSGQGAQAVGMGKDLYDSNAAAKAVFDMGEAVKSGVLSMCFEGPQEDLNQTQNTQPCLFLTDLAMAEALKAEGIECSAAAGFSLGEIPAAAFSGMLTKEEAFRLVMLRGSKMAEVSAVHPGGMAAALKLPRETVEGVCANFSEVWPVNYNCPGQISCAGNAAQIDDFVAAIKAAGGRAVKLAVSGAFHTPYMKEASEALAEALKDMNISSAEIPVYANRTALPYGSTRDEITETLSLQASSPVRFEDTLRNMQAAGIDTFVEVGVGSTLANFVRRTLPDAKSYAVNSLESLNATVQALKEAEE